MVRNFSVKGEKARCRRRYLGFEKEEEEEKDVEAVGVIVVEDLEEGVVDVFGGDVEVVEVPDVVVVKEWDVCTEEVEEVKAVPATAEAKE